MPMVASGLRCALLTSLCVGCSLQATKPAPPALPQAFVHSLSADGGTWPAKDWFHQFANPELDSLIRDAADDNLDVSMARSRVLQADARARQAHAAIVPSVDANGTANFLAGHSSNGSASETDWGVLLSASYELDFWGKNHATADAAHYLSIASRADRDTIALTTLAGVADTYFQVLSLRERLAIARSNVAAAQALSEIVDARYSAGLSNPVEVAAQKSVLASAQLAIPELERQEQESVAALAALTGRTLEGFTVQGQQLDVIQEPHVSAGLPSELLRRRPDLLAAEANLASASADLVAARAALYPSLTLTAAGGIQDPALNAAITSLAGVGPSINLGAALLQPIFNGGRLRAARAQAEARQQELASNYRAVILAALMDVENALSAIQHLNAAGEFESEHITQSERAFEGAQLRFKAGSGDFLSVLEAQRTLYTARDQFSQYRLARLQAIVSLCKALGGGWQSPDTAPSALAKGG
jgi:multidrug efflux system outer membrane protein